MWAVVQEFTGSSRASAGIQLIVCGLVFVIFLFFKFLLLNTCSWVYWKTVMFAEGYRPAYRKITTAIEPSDLPRRSATAGTDRLKNADVLSFNDCNPLKNVVLSVCHACRTKLSS